MFTKIKDPRILIYDGETDRLIGMASFELTPEAEKALLGLVNYGIKPSTITLLDINLYQPDRTYVPPTPFDAYKREGTIYALFTDSSTGENIPVEIQMKYTARARGNIFETLYHFDSVEFSDIEIESVKINY
ncbi:hypothetical protein [Clostridium aminobutyricum]|uniref:Uncharacterized protein n=1 Tax=Clostridium aminobutyricum TaxID=33953 RepID=A0A939IID6_CLOAM|nr:hypothetical protein [Clostridium aminobutyricum]MBN7772961.1 hypothetical protein [Clostridium aminobutyricum]